MLKLIRSNIVRVIENKSGKIKDNILLGQRKVQLNLVDSKNKVNIIFGVITKLNNDTCIVTTDNGEEYTFDPTSFFDSHRGLYTKGDLSFSVKSMYTLETDEGEVICQGMTVDILDKNKYIIYDNFKISGIIVDKETNRCKLLGFQNDDNFIEKTLDFGTINTTTEYTEIIPDNGNSINLKFGDKAKILRMSNFNFYDYISNLTIESCLFVEVLSNDGYSKIFTLGTKGDAFNLPVTIFKTKIMKLFVLLWYDKKNKKVGIIDIHGDKSLYWVDAFELFSYITKKKIDEIKLIKINKDEVKEINHYDTNSIRIIDTRSSVSIDGDIIGNDIVFYSCADDEEKPFISAYGELVKLSINQTSIKFVLKTEYAGRVAIDLNIKDVLRGELKDIPVLMNKIINN